MKPMDPDIVAAKIHEALESTTIMRCRTRQVGNVAVGVIVFSSNLPEDEVDRQAEHMDRVAIPPDAMAAILVRPMAVAVAVHRLAGPMARLINSIVVSACEAVTGEPPEHKQVSNAFQTEAVLN